jgi:transposase
MERSTIQYLKKKGWTNAQIADFTGHHRDTIAKVLKEEVDKKPQPRHRESTVVVYAAWIEQWLDKHIPVSRMLEMARADQSHPYAGGETAFYDYVRKLRRQRKLAPTNLALRFEGMPGEFLQIDWGEVRDFPFTKVGMQGQTRYFFAARLKHSRFMYVSFHTDMREETLLRCLIACFTTIGGVRALVSRDGQHEDGCPGAHGRERTHLESGLPETGQRIPFPSRCVRAGLGQSEGGRRESGEICEEQFSPWTQLS